MRRPRGLPRLPAEESGGKTKREKERNMYMRVQIYICIYIHIYIYMDAFCQYLYFNDMRHRVLCLFLPRCSAHRAWRKRERERERKKGKRAEKVGWMVDAPLSSRVYLPFFRSDISCMRTASNRRHACEDD